MIHNPLSAIAIIVVLGIGLQWLAWRLHLPSILLLLLGGVVIGPATGWMSPDTLFGDLLLPATSVGVALILFEGGMSLELSELKGMGGVLRSLVSIGAVVTWVIAGGAAYLILGFEVEEAALLGAVLTVTGPTVIGPLLRHVRPTRRVGSVLRWEGILIDPVGAILAVLTFEATVARRFGEAAEVVAIGVLEAAGVGLAVGLGAAALVVLLLRRYLVPDFLHNGFTLAVVVGAFTAANGLRSESGLLAVTVMGIALANQKFTPVTHIIEFKESLRVLLLSGLFIVLAARLDRSDITHLGLDTVGFIAVLVLLARPASVLISTLGSKLSWRERAFVAAVAPRGIVAAAVASVFALELIEQGRPGGEQLVPVTFAVIVGTIALYSTSASWIARKLKLAAPHPQGVVFVGAHPWARKLAGVLKDEGYSVLVTDTDWANVSAARMNGLPAFYGSAISDHALNELELSGIGRLLAVTSNDEVNALAAQRYASLFGRKEVYQLAPKGTPGGRMQAVATHLRGRSLFAEGTTFAALSERFADGRAAIKVTNLTKEFDFKAFLERYGRDALPLFVLGENGDLGVVAADRRSVPKAGVRLVALVDAERAEKRPADPAGKRSEAPDLGL